MTKACAVVFVGVGFVAGFVIWVTRDIPTLESGALDPDDPENPFEIDGPRLYRPPYHISTRIAAQGSVLMLCKKPTTPVVLPFYTKKIVIEDVAQFTLKKRLNACGVNRRHLFPDLAGLSDHLGWLYKHNWLAGYKRGSGNMLDPENFIEHDDADDLVE